MKIELTNQLVLDVLDDRQGQYPSVTIVIDREAKGQYPEHMAVKFTKGEHLDKRANVRRGQRVDITFHAQSRESKGRWYNNFTGTFCKVVGGIAEPQGGPIDEDVPFRPYGGIS